MNTPDQSQVKTPATGTTAMSRPDAPRLFFGNSHGGHFLSTVVLILLAATACRLYALDFAGLWADELWGVDACSLGSWWAMIDSMILKDSHPPGYQTLLYFWMQWFGDGDAAVRMPSVLAGVMAVYALYALAKRFLTTEIALLASTLLAVSYNAIYYSQEARAYIFILLFAIWHFHLFLLLFMENQQSTRHWIGFWLVGILLCYFHYIGVVIVASEALALLLVPAFRQKPATFFKAFQAIFILYLPWALVMLRHLMHPDQSWETVVPGWRVLVGTARFIWGPANLQFYPMFGAFVGFLVFAFYQRRQLSVVDRRLLLLLLLAFIPWLLFFIKSHVSESAYTIRHFLYIIPVVTLVTARVIAGFLQWLNDDHGIKTLGCLLAVLVWVMMALNVSGSIAMGGKLYAGITKHEYREAVAVIASDADFIAHEKKNVFIANLFFDHYLKKARIRYKPAPFLHENAVAKMPEYTKYISDHGMRNFYYLEVFQDVGTRKPSPVLQELQKRYHTVCATRFFWVQVLKFNTQLPPNPADKPKSCPRSVAVEAMPAGQAAPASEAASASENLDISESPAGNALPASPASPSPAGLPAGPSSP